MTVQTLADLRRRKGMTQAQVADKLHVSPKQVSRIEAAYPQVMFTSLRAYLDAIGVDIRFLSGDLSVLSGDIEPDPVRQAAVRARQNDPTRQGRSKVVSDS
jgi:transcriptional regulator with XRE-family HTH domain